MTEFRGVPVLAGERLDDLQRDGMFLLQKPEAFRFGMDSVLLAAFAAEGRVGRVRAADLGSGSGVLPLLICGRISGAAFDAVEIDPGAADRAVRSVRICGMQQRVRVHAVPLESAPKLLGYGQFDLVVSNPPYGEVTSSAASAPRDGAVREGQTGLAAVCKSASALLKNGGSFCLCFPARRLSELIVALSVVGMEPKRLRMVCPKPGKDAKIVLLEAKRGAKPGMRVLPPLFLSDEAALRDIYES